MGREGRRPGAGRKKGSKEPSTLAKEAARELLRQTDTAHIEPMVQAQIGHHTGVTHLMDPDRALWGSGADHILRYERAL